jgi:hypothetical protein
MKIILLVTALIMSSSSFALTIKEKKQLADWNAQLTDSENTMTKLIVDKCGIKVPVKLDEKFATAFMEANASAAGYCESVRTSIANMCDDKIAKDAIAKKLKSIDCKAGKPEETSFKWNGGALQVTLGLNAANIEDKTKNWIENNL